MGSVECSASTASAVIRVRVRIKEHRKVFFLPWERHNETKKFLFSDVMMVCGEMYIMYVSPEMEFEVLYSYKDGYPLSIRGYVEWNWTRAQGELKQHDDIFFPILVYTDKKGSSSWNINSHIREGNVKWEVWGSRLSYLIYGIHI